MGHYGLPPPLGPMRSLTWGAVGSSKVGAQPAEEEEDGYEEGAEHHHGWVSRGAHVNNPCAQPTHRAGLPASAPTLLPAPQHRLPRGAHPARRPTSNSNGDRGSLQWGPAAHPSGAPRLIPLGSCPPSCPGPTAHPSGPRCLPQWDPADHPAVFPWLTPPCHRAHPPQGCPPGAGPVGASRPTAQSRVSWAGSLRTGQNWEALGQSRGGQLQGDVTKGLVGAVTGGGREG